MRRNTLLEAGMKLVENKIITFNCVTENYIQHQIYTGQTKKKNIHYKRLLPGKKEVLSLKTQDLGTNKENRRGFPRVTIYVSIYK